MADSCLWRSWETRLDWTANPTVAPDIRTRLTAFLTPVCAAIADLAATLTDATDDDLIAVLGPQVLALLGPLPVAARARPVGALLGLLDSPDAEPAAEDRLRAWRLAVNTALEGKAPAVQLAIVAVFLDRVLRARLTGPEAADGDVLDHAAEVLVTAISDLLHEVGSRAIPPEAYHVM